MHKIDRFVSAGRIGSASEDSKRLNNELPIDEMNTVVVPNNKGIFNKIKGKFKKPKKKED